MRVYDPKIEYYTHHMEGTHKNFKQTPSPTLGISPTLATSTNEDASLPPKYVLGDYQLSIYLTPLLVKYPSLNLRFLPH